MRNEPIPERLGRSRHSSQPDLMDGLGFQAVGICDKNKAHVACNNVSEELGQKGTPSMSYDSTKTASGKVNNDNQSISPYERLHQAASLPDKATALLATFDAIAGIGCLPVALGPDSKGGIKKPTGGADWGLQPLDTRRRVFVKAVNGEARSGTLDAMGIGLQPRGRLLVIDVDPPGKDRTKLDESLAELTELSGGECPLTFQVDGQGGCHLWFTVSDRLLNQWAKVGRGKTVIRLVCGGSLELFMPMEDTQYQVATAPSTGKTIACHIDPAPLPEPFEAALLAMFCQADKKATPAAPFIGDADRSWTAREKCFRAIINQCDKAIRSAPQGSKHDAIRDRSLLLAGYAGGMGYTGMKAECTSVLIEAAMAVGSSAREASRVVSFGWINGIEKPLIPSDPRYLKIEQDFADRASRLAAERVKTGSLIESLASKAASLPVEDSQRAANVGHILALMKDRRWLWGDKDRNLGWFVERGLHLVEGKEGTGKTRWLMDLCRRWSLDLRWPDGTKTGVDCDAKLLIVASDSHWDQIAETSVAFGIPEQNVIFTGPENDPYSFTDIDDPGTLAVIRLRLQQEKVAMVVVDTLMAASSRPLVDPQEVAKIARPLRELSREFGVPIVMVGHLNKDGETYGRSIGRTCDHVIRMEVDEADEQAITIRSVKARWNRFELPTLVGRQGECGWEYSMAGSDAGDTKQAKGRAGAEVLIIDYLKRHGKTAWSEIQDEIQEQGSSKSAIDRALKNLTSNSSVMKTEQAYPSGKSQKFYEVHPS